MKKNPHQESIGRTDCTPAETNTDEQKTDRHPSKFDGEIRTPREVDADDGPPAGRTLGSFGLAKGGSRSPTPVTES